MQEKRISDIPFIYFESTVSAFERTHRRTVISMSVAIVIASALAFILGRIM